MDLEIKSILKLMKFNKKSFTLIELLIVITVIALFSGLSIAYYNNFTNEKKLEAGANQVYDALELAKKKTSSGDLSGETCEVFDGYEVKSSADGSSYSLSLCCTGSCGTLIYTYNLTSPITFNHSSLSIQFLVLTAPVTAQTFIIKSSSLNKCINIDINTAGLIEMGDRDDCS